MAARVKVVKRGACGGVRNIHYSIGGFIREDFHIFNQISYLECRQLSVIPQNGLSLGFHHQRYAC